jgi:CheY-like chemotaxis protein
VPIIAMTAYAMKSDRERCMAAGMDAYLAKPIHPQEMIALVEALAEALPHGESTTESDSTALNQPVVQEAAADDRAAQVFDPEVALARCADDPEMLLEMIECFLTEMDSGLPRIRAAMEKRDLMEVGRLGHRMKGTVVYLGAEPAKQASLAVERFSKTSGGTIEEAEAAVNALEQACLALKSAVTEHLRATESN